MGEGERREVGAWARVAICARGSAHLVDVSQERACTTRKRKGGGGGRRVRGGRDNEETEGGDRETAARLLVLQAPRRRHGRLLPGLRVHHDGAHLAGGKDSSGRAGGRAGNGWSGFWVGHVARVRVRSFVHVCMRAGTVAFICACTGVQKCSRVHTRGCGRAYVRMSAGPTRRRGSARGRGVAAPRMRVRACACACTCLRNFAPLFEGGKGRREGWRLKIERGGRERESEAEFENESEQSAGGGGLCRGAGGSGGRRGRRGCPRW